MAGGISLADLLREQRARDIPLVLLLGSFSAWHWMEFRRGHDLARTA